jgi:hypothetical protein
MYCSVIKIMSAIGWPKSMSIVRRGQSGPDIKELANAGLTRQEAHRPAQESPVRADAREYLGPARDHLPGGLAIRLEIVFPAEQVVVYPRRMRHGDVETERATVVLIARHERTL